MSESSYRYRFFFPSNRQAHAVRARIADLNDYQAVARQLGFLSCLAEGEYLDAVILSSEYCEIVVGVSASSDINHRLIRASKDIGSEFCIVDMINSQVGESAKRFLLRGQDVDEGTREELIQRYAPLLPAVIAVERGDTDSLKRLLQAGLDVDLVYDDRRLLEIALDNRRLEVFKLLLDSGANANVRLGSGDPLPLYAAKYLSPPDCQFAVLLVKHGADIHVRDKDGASLLWHMGRLSRELFQVLDRRGAELHRPDGIYEGKPPLAALAIACEYFDKPNIIAFFKHCVKNRQDWPQIARVALCHDVPSLVSTLIKHGYLATDVDASVFAPLFDAALLASSAQSFQFVYSLAHDKGLDFEDKASDFLNRLADKTDAVAAIDALLTRYPAALSTSALGCAIHARMADNLTAILKHGTPFDEFAAEHGCSLLSYNLDCLDVPCTRALLDAGLDLGTDEGGEMLLEHCLNRSDCPRGVKRLLASCAKDLPVHQRLFIYIAGGDMGAFRTALSSLDDEQLRYANVESLLMAAAKSDPEFVRFLLEWGAQLPQLRDLATKAIGLAIVAGRVDCAALLLGAGADANAPVFRHVPGARDADDSQAEQGNQADEQEVTADASKLIQRLFGWGDAPADKLVEQLEPQQALTPDASCLMYCASQGQLTLCRLLMKYGAQPWQQDAGGKDALSYAILLGHNGCVDFFVQQSGFAELGKDAHGRYLYSAALAANVYAIKALFKGGVSADAEHPEETVTPLLLATIASGSEGSIDVIDALLKGGAPTGYVDNQGRTPLIHACIANNQAAIKRLLRSGGFPSHVDAMGNCALDYFSAHGVDAKHFSLEELMPKQRFIGVKKWLVSARPILLKLVIPAYVLLSIVAIFSEAVATYGLCLLLVLFLFKYLRELKAARAETQPSKGLALALSAIGLAVADNEKKQQTNQAIIKSWND